MRFENAFQEIHHGVLMVDAEGHLAASNRAAREMLNLNEEEVGKKVREFLSVTKINKVLQSGLPEFNDKVVIEGRNFIFHHQPVFEGEKVKGVVSSFQDIKDLEVVARELEDIKELYRELEDIKELNRELEAIFNSSYDEIYVTDSVGTTLRVNKACERFYGLRAEEIVGQHVNELEKQGLFSPSITPQVLKEKKRITSVQTTKSGQKLIVTCNPVFDESGQIIRIVTNSRDITELSNLRQRLEETEKLMEIYRAEIVQLHTERLTSIEVVGQSSIIKHVFEMAEKVAGVDSTVLIQGESGVGKGVIASKIHNFSKRSEGAFITINCGAIPENLMESELFGYEGGAFTGAQKQGKKGLVELANGGTIFLDEITELPLNLQVKLLHVIQEKKIMRVGGNDYINVDIRIIAATNRDIQQLIRERGFREDLYYRLNVVPLIVPPLRHRKEDVPLLLDYFLRALCAKYQFSKKFSPEVIDLLSSYNWPGNVRELENLVERLVVTTDSPEVLPVHLPDYILHANGNLENVFVLDICPLKDAMDEVERQLLKKAFSKYRNTYRMAQALEVNQSTIVRKMHRLGICKEKETVNDEHKES